MGLMILRGRIRFLCKEAAKSVNLIQAAFSSKRKDGEKGNVFAMGKMGKGLYMARLENRNKG